MPGGRWRSGKILAGVGSGELRAAGRERDRDQREDEQRHGIFEVAVHEPAEHAALTLPYLRTALDSLPYIQANRRIFFLGNWLGAFIGGQRSPEALAIVQKYLTDNPNLPLDLRQKVLQTVDELERTVRIRRTWGRTAS